jgi:hypothetical protein
MVGIPPAGQLPDTASVPRFGQLGSFCTFCPLRPGPTAEIGFVSQDCPHAPSSLRPRPTRRRRELGLFRIFRPPGIWSCPSRARLGLFRTIGPRGPEAGNRRLGVPAQLCIQSAIRNPKSAIEELALFRMTAPMPLVSQIPSPRLCRELGSFGTFLFRRPQPPAPIPGRSPEIGFVSHNEPPGGAVPQISYPAQVWLCFAQLASG